MSRKLFDELQEGFDALESRREKKLTLREHKVQLKLHKVDSEELVALRTKLGLSQSVFASYLGVNKRTLENWEQGRSQPNGQTAKMVKLIQRFPKTIENLAELAATG